MGKMKKTAILGRLLRYLMVHRAYMLAAIFLTLAANGLALVGPYLSGCAIDAVEPGVGKVDFPKVFLYCGLMAICYLVSAGMTYLINRIIIKVSRQVVFHMRAQVFSKITQLPVGYFDTHQTGDMLSRISYDIDTINTSLSTDMVQIFASTATVIGSLAMMLMISPLLTLVFAVTVPLAIFLTKKITSFTRPLFRARSKKLGELNGFVEERIGGQKTLKAYNQEKRTIQKLDVQNEETVQAYYKAEYYGNTVGPSVNFVNCLSLSLVSLFGTLLFLNGHMTVGNIASFVLYSRKFSGPINEVANIFGELQSTFSAAERVFALLDEEVEPADRPDAESLLQVQGDIALHHVDFGYKKGAPVIRDLSLHAPKGALIAIVGPTGAGKTTLVNLLMRFYDPDSGSVTMDGHDIRDLHRKDVRRAYSVVLQDTWLFSGTVFENIAYGKEGATREEVQKACQAAGIDSFIRSLPKGYDTMIHEDASNLSKGQKQLMTIARAMLLPCELLILDEATSNVDTRTEEQIQAAMRTLMKDKTCFVIAHRLSTVRNADCILVVRDGQVVEQGRHEELMEQGGFYAKLYQAQFS